MIKLTKRKGFNFFRSYYDVYNELETIEDKIAFIDALLDRQFLGIKPTELRGMAKFAYISQTNSIDSQVKGFEDKTGVILTPTQPPTQGVILPPALQIEEKVEVEVKEKVKDIPTFSEFLIYAKEKEPSVKESALKNKYDAWVANDWNDGNDSKIKNWKSKLCHTLPFIEKETAKTEKIVAGRQTEATIRQNLDATGLYVPGLEKK